VFLLDKLRRIVGAAMPYLVVITVVCALVAWYAHPRLPPTRAQRTQAPAHRATDRVPVGASARCSDGTYSFNEHRSSACMHHGGVAVWLNH